MNLTKISSVFELSPGQIVYDESSNRKGKISDVRESRVECIDAYVIWDGEDEEVVLNLWPHVKLVG